MGKSDKIYNYLLLPDNVDIGTGKPKKIQFQ